MNTVKNKTQNRMKKLSKTLMVLTLCSSASVFAQAQERTWTNTYHGDDQFGQLHTRNGPRIVTSDNPVDDVTTYTYYTAEDGQYIGQLKTITNALEQVIAYNEYDAVGRVKSVTGINGVTQEFEYYPRGWLESSTIKGPGGDLRTEYGYFKDGELQFIKSPDGSELHFDYNDANHLTEIVNHLGERIDYTPDLAGNITDVEIREQTGGDIKYSLAKKYDELSRVMDVLGTDGQQTHIDYDKNGNMEFATELQDSGESENPTREAVTETQYDALNRIKKIIDPANGETEFGFENSDLTYTVTDANLNATTYKYNFLGDLVSLDSPDTGKTLYEYEDGINRTKMTDARGVVTDYKYDALNRLTDVNYSIGETPDPSLDIKYEYGDTGTSSEDDFDVGHLTKITDNISNVTEYSHDHLGRVTSKDVIIDGLSKSVGYAYEGQTKYTITYPSGRSVDYNYIEGRLDSVKTKASGTATEVTLADDAQYYPFGPMHEWDLGNGLEYKSEFDTDYRVESIELSNGSTIFQRIYDYDRSNNIKSIDNGVDSSKDQVFEYSLLNQLLNADGVYGQLVFDYDPVGNRKSRTETFDGEVTIQSNTYFDGSNQLETSTTTIDGDEEDVREFTYDNAGNLEQQVKDGDDFDYEYNSASRMESVTVEGELKAEYLYNALGQKVQSLHGSYKETYIYNEAGQLLAVLGNTGQTVREYIYMGGQILAVIVVPPATSVSDILTFDNTTGFGSQNSSQSSFEINNSGTSITLNGDAWRVTNETFTITPNTYIEFDFESDNEGEVQGIGFEDDTHNTSRKVFNISGYQSYGNRKRFDYQGGVQHYMLPVVPDMVGENMRIVFVNDNDAAETETTSTVSNLRICEGPCTGVGTLVKTLDLSTTTPYDSQDENGTFNSTSTESKATGNRWRQFADSFTVTENTYISFEYESDGLGEVQGIAVDDLNDKDSSRSFKLTGTDRVGVRDFKYTGGGAVQIMSIPVGQFYTGTNMHLVHMNDSDRVETVGKSTIRNVRICEGPCPIAETDPQLYYMHNDHLGTPQMMTDEGQKVVWVTDYTPYGMIVNGDEKLEKTRFPGQYYDFATGLHYNYFRDYDASLGRYIQSDPIGLDGGINTYAYVGGNPLKYSDPYGLALTIPIYIERGYRLKRYYDAYRLMKEFQALGPMTGTADLGIPQWRPASEWEDPASDADQQEAATACSSSDDPNDRGECDKEWNEARRSCRQMIMLQLGAQAGRFKGNKEIKKVTGGYTDVEQCAAGLVSKKCGGNKVDKRVKKRKKNWTFKG